MKRYLAFFFYFYYPSGGWDDFIGDFDSKEEAIDSIWSQAIQNQGDKEKLFEHCGGHIIDLATKKIVWER